VSRRDIRKASGTQSFLDLARSPGRLLRSGNGEADMANLREGLTIAVSAFMRTRVAFRQGRLLLCAAAPAPMVWEQYRFILGYQAVKPLAPPYSVTDAGTVAGRGAWNVDKYLFRAADLVAGTEVVEIAVPAADLAFLSEASAWLNQQRPLLADSPCRSGCWLGGRTRERRQGYFKMT